MSRSTWLCIISGGGGGVGTEVFCGGRGTPACGMAPGALGADKTEFGEDGDGGGDGGIYCAAAIPAQAMVATSTKLDENVFIGFIVFSVLRCRR